MTSTQAQTATLQLKVFVSMVALLTPGEWCRATGARMQTDRAIRHPLQRVCYVRRSCADDLTMRGTVMPAIPSTRITAPEITIEAGYGSDNDAGPKHIVVRAQGREVL